MPNVTTGGRALAFWSSLRVGLNKLSFDDAEKKIFPDEKFMKVGVRVAKNRCVYDHPYKKAHYYVEYGIGTDKMADVIANAPDADSLRQSGSWYYRETPDGELVEHDAIVKGKKVADYPMKWNSRKALRNFLVENEWFLKELQTEIANAGIMADHQDEEELEEIKKLEQIMESVEAEEEKALKKAEERKAMKAKAESVDEKPAKKKTKPKKEETPDE